MGIYLFRLYNNSVLYNESKLYSDNNNNSFTHQKFPPEKEKTQEGGIKQMAIIDPSISNKNKFPDAKKEIDITVIDGKPSIKQSEPNKIYIKNKLIFNLQKFNEILFLIKNII